MRPIQKLYTLLHILWIKFLLLTTDTNLYQIEIIGCKRYNNEKNIGYCLKTKKYYDIHSTPFVDNIINHSYKKQVKHESIRKGKLVKGKILLT